MPVVRNVIVRVGCDVTGMQQSLQQAQKNLEKFGAKMESIGQGLKDVGGKLSAGITLPIVALGAASVMVAQDVKDSTNKIQAALGVTADEAKNLTGVAKDMWKNGFGANVQEAADGLILVKQSMEGLSDVDLKAVTEAAFTLKDVFGAELNETTRTASVMMKNFGISGQKAMDIMTVGFQKGGNFSDELLDTLREYSPQFKTMGFNAEQMLGILIEGTKAGAFNMDKVGDAMKEFSIRAIDGSKASTEAFTALGFKAEDMSKKFAEGGEGAKTAFTGVVAAIATVKDPLKQNAMGVALFGTQWEDLKFKVIDSMAKGVDSIKSVEGATKKAGDALYNTLGARLDGIKRRVQDALIPFGDKILDLADRIFPKLEKALDPIIKMLNSLSPEQTGLILVIAGIVAAIGPALVALGLMVSGAGAVSTALAGLSGAIMGISLPIIAVVAAIALLVGAFLYLWNTNKEFKAFMITAWENIKTSLLSIWDSIKIIAIAVWGFLKDFWDKWGTQITAFLVGAWEGIVGMLRGVFQIIDGMMKIFAVIFSGDWSNLWEGIALVFSGIWQVISSQFGVVLQGIKLLFTTIFSDITENIRQKMNSIIGFINPIIGLINKITGAKFDNITNFRAPAAAKGTVPRATGMQQFALGTNYVPDNMVAMLHKGEAVVPAKYNNKSNGGITLNITGNTISNDYDVNRIMNIATKRLRYEGVY